MRRRLQTVVNVTPRVGAQRGHITAQIEIVRVRKRERERAERKRAEREGAERERESREREREIVGDFEGKTIVRHEELNVKVWIERRSWNGEREKYERCRRL